MEELYLTGLHLSQCRHPTRSPLPYWKAALERDRGDARTNLALADHAYRAGRYSQALGHIDAARERLTRRNANPVDAEVFYLLGLTLERLGRPIEAEAAFGKAGWDGGWSAAAGFALAQSLSRRGQNRAALRVLDTLDGIVGHDTRRIALRAIVLRRLGRVTEAAGLVSTALLADPLDATLRLLAAVGPSEEAGLLLDVALDLRDAGATEQALATIALAVNAPITAGGNVRPIAHYIAAAMLDAHARPADAAAHRAAARQSDLTWAFPHGLDHLDALASAIQAEPDDAVAHSLMGMLLYAHGRRREASEHWDRAIELELKDPVLHRNAGLAAFNVQHDDARAWDRYVEAIELAPTDARLRYEQDQLAARLGHTVAQRLERLRPIEHLVLTRDDFTIEFVRLLLAGGAEDRAYEILVTRPFHPWEGGEGQAIAAWDATSEANGLPLTDPPATLGEARSHYTPPVARRHDGVTDYFATSLPELLLFARESGDD